MLKMLKIHKLSIFILFEKFVNLLKGLPKISAKSQFFAKFQLAQSSTNSKPTQTPILQPYSSLKNSLISTSRISAISSKCVKEK